jgi:hypothetical protein
MPETVLLHNAIPIPENVNDTIEIRASIAAKSTYMPSSDTGKKGLTVLELNFVFRRTGIELVALRSHMDR